MVTVAKANPTVGVVGSYWLLGTVPAPGPFSLPNTFMTGTEICRWQLLNHPEKYVFGTATSLLVRSDLIRNRDPFYDENCIYEDLKVCYELLKSCDFGFVHQFLTVTRVDNESISSGIRHLSPWILHAILALRKYGPQYLDAAEYTQRLQTLTDRYYKVLADWIVYGKDKGFWDYHNAGLRSEGQRINRIRLAIYVLRELMDSLRHPRKLIRALALNRTHG
jgi:hypothetical protein